MRITRADTAVQRLMFPRAFRNFLGNLSEISLPVWSSNCERAAGVSLSGLLGRALAHTPYAQLYEYALYNSHSKRTSMLHEPVET